MMLFIWIALIYVIVAFTDITAGTFVAGTEELKAAAGAGFHPGGAVAAASRALSRLSLSLGLVQRFLRPPLWLATVVFVPASFAAAWLGTHWSHVLRPAPRDVGAPHPRLLLPGLGRAGVAAAAAARVPGRVHPLRRAGRRGDRRLLRRLSRSHSRPSRPGTRAGPRAPCSRSCSSPSPAARAPGSTAWSARARPRSRWPASRTRCPWATAPCWPRGSWPSSRWSPS